MTAFAKGLSARAMPGSRRLGERFQWRRVPPVSVYFMPGRILQGAFFLTVLVQKEVVPVVSRSLRVALSSHRTESKLVDVRLNEYLQGGHLSSSIERGRYETCFQVVDSFPLDLHTAFQDLHCFDSFLYWVVEASR